MDQNCLGTKLIGIEMWSILIQNVRFGWKKNETFQMFTKMGLLRFTSALKSEHKMTVSVSESKVMYFQFAFYPCLHPSHFPTFLMKSVPGLAAFAYAYLANLQSSHCVHSFSKICKVIGPKYLCISQFHLILTPTPANNNPQFNLSPPSLGRPVKI